MGDEAQQAKNNKSNNTFVKNHQLPFSPLGEVVISFHGILHMEGVNSFVEWQI